MNPDDPTLQTTVLDELPEQPPEHATPPLGDEPDGGERTPPPKPKPDLEAAMAELAGTVSRISAPKEEPVKPPTAEEIADFWKVYDPEQTDKEFFKKWFRLNPDATAEEIQSAKELFAGFQKGLMRQAVTASRNYVAMERAAIDKEYGPLKEYVEEQKREATRGRFYGDYPALKETKFQKIIDATARTLDGKVFASESEYFKALAEGAADSIKAILPEFDLGAKPTTKKPGQTPKLPRTSAGGGGGAGKGATSGMESTGSKNDIDSLDPDAE